MRRTKKDAEKTREALLDAAERIFLEKGVSATSLHEIAQAAQVTRGALYWHFASKQALFQAMHQRVQLPTDRLFESVFQEDDPLNGLKKLCIHVLKNLAHDERARRVFTIVLLKCEKVEQFMCTLKRERREEVLGRFQKIFTIARKKGQLAQGISPESAAIALHAYMGGIFADYLRNTESMDVEAQATKLVNLFFRGIEA